MIIQRSTNKIPPIFIQPRNNPDDWKSPTQLRLERESNITNDKTKRIAQQAVDNVYKQMQKVVENTEYNISLRIGDSGAAKQFQLSMKKDGTVIASLPPEAAINMAEKAKESALGLLFDLSA